MEEGLAEKVKDYLCVEALQEARDDHDGTLAKLLELIADDGGHVLDEEQFAVLNDVYSRALNKVDCSCGSGRPFKDCCKNYWNWVRRGYENRKKEDGRLRKECKRDDASMAEFKELVAVEVNMQGNLRMKFSDAAKCMPLVALADVLHRAWQEVFVQITTQVALQASRQGKPGVYGAGVTNLNR